MGIFSMFSNKNEKAGRDEYTRGLNLGRSKAFGQLDEGERDLRGQYGRADSYFADLFNRYGAGSKLYADALGLGGEEGRNRARGAFQAGPGYQFGVDEALKGVMRNASATGSLASGNTLAALQSRALGLANQEYGGWLDRLGGYDAKAMNTAGSRAGIATGLGDRLLGLAGDRAGIDWAAETGIGTARGNYELDKDRTSGNIFGALTGGLKLGAKLLGAR